MVGHGVGEMINEAAMAMRFRATLHEFIFLLHVFSTMAEALKAVPSRASRIPRSCRAARNRFAGVSLASRCTHALSTLPHGVSSLGIS